MSNKKIVPGNNITYFTKKEDVLSGSDIVIAPVSSTDENGYLKNKFIAEKVQLTEEFFAKMSQQAVLVIGKANSFVSQNLASQKINFIEIASRDDFAILNAIPTAEGAINLAITETPFTIYGYNILILGLGRVGFVLARRLNLLGANVYSCTRDPAAVARGKDLGIEMLSYDELDFHISRMNLVYNTVPALILDKELLEQMNKKTVIIDLASEPGGTDFKTAKKLGIKAILATGLPGKIAPVSAGNILTEIIFEIIENTEQYLK